MNWIGFVLGFLFFITWTMLVGFACYRTGEENAEKQIVNRSKDIVLNTYAPTLDANEVAESLESLETKFAVLDSQVQHLHERKQMTGGLSMGAERRLELMEPLMERVSKVEAVTADLLLRDETYRDRFTRVERKAGMSV